MKNLIISVFLLFLTFLTCEAQYDAYGFVISGGTNYSRYLGKGEGQNTFETTKPGFQLELSFNNQDNFEWIFYGVSYFKSDNIVGRNTLPVEFWVPYYTEFQFYQREKKHPLFIFFGGDYVRMKFPGMESADGHYNLTIGGGWNLKIANPLYLQFKVKPYYIFDNSVGQHFGFNAMANIHIGVSK
jgi:hypothetical protein